MESRRDRNSHEGRERLFMDVDRMVNEGLGGGRVTPQNGLIGETTTDTMNEAESARDGEPADDGSES